MDLAMTNILRVAVKSIGTLIFVAILVFQVAVLLWEVSQIMGGW
jgi:hypothetical protein